MKKAKFLEKIYSSDIDGFSYSCISSVKPACNGKYWIVKQDDSCDFLFTNCGDANIKLPDDVKYKLVKNLLELKYSNGKIWLFSEDLKKHCPEIMDEWNVKEEYIETILDGDFALYRKDDLKITTGVISEKCEWTIEEDYIKVPADDGRFILVDKKTLNRSSEITSYEEFGDYLKAINENYCEYLLTKDLSGELELGGKVILDSGYVIVDGVDNSNNLIALPDLSAYIYFVDSYEILANHIVLKEDGKFRIYLKDLSRYTERGIDYKISDYYLEVSFEDEDICIYDTNLEFKTRHMVCKSWKESSEKILITYPSGRVENLRKHQLPSAHNGYLDSFQRNR